MSAQTIVFVHGLFVTRHCWDGWISRYQDRGHTCSAIAWPGRDSAPAALRQRHPDQQLAKLTLAEVIAHHEQVIRALPEPPLIIGHSMGGLIAQILLQRGLASAAVAIDSAPPRGIFSLKWSFLKANWPTLNLLRSARQPHLMSFKEFQYAFVNGMPLAEQQAAYEASVVPESLRTARGALSSLATIDFRQARGPLLLVAGSADQIIPASLNQANYRAYRSSPARTEFKQFAGRNHFLIGQPGWEEIADFSLDWLTQSR
jgi:pimeloyl-ACP methyl ester carboxylesterase